MKEDNHYMRYPSHTSMFKSMYLSNKPAEGLPLQTIFSSLIKSPLSKACCTSSNLDNRNIIRHFWYTLVTLYIQLIYLSFFFHLQKKMLQGKKTQLTGGLVLSKAPMAILKPAPSPMRTFSLGILTSSKVMPLVSEHLWPMFNSCKNQN